MATQHPREVNTFDFFQDLQSARAECQVTALKEPIESFFLGQTLGIELITSAQAQGRKVIFIGNGGSAGIASHLSVDFWKNGNINAIAFNDSSLLTCISNDFGYAHVFEQPVKRFAQSGDLLIAISSSGRSENILRGVQAAQEAGCRVMTLSGFSPDNPLREAGDLNFYLPSDSYGIVEVGHLAILHGMLDAIVDAQKAKHFTEHTALAEA